jgi:hypothetical protein
VVSKAAPVFALPLFFLLSVVCGGCKLVMSQVWCFCSSGFFLTCSCSFDWRLCQVSTRVAPLVLDNSTTRKQLRKVVQHGIGLPQVGIFVSGPLDDNWRMYSLVDTVFSYRVRMLLICLRYDGVFGLQSVKLQYFVLTKRCLLKGRTFPTASPWPLAWPPRFVFRRVLCAFMSSLRLKRNVLSSIFSQVKVRSLLLAGEGNGFLRQAISWSTACIYIYSVGPYSIGYICSCLMFKVGVKIMSTGVDVSGEVGRPGTKIWRGCKFDKSRSVLMYHYVTYQIVRSRLSGINRLALQKTLQA